MAVLKSFLSASSAIAVTNVSQILTLAVCARILSAEQFALYLTTISLAWVISPLTSFMMNDSLAYYLGKENLVYSEERQVLLGLLSVYLAHVSIVLFLLFCISKIVPQFISVGPLESLYFIVFLSAFLLTSSRFIFDSVFRFMNMRGRYLISAFCYFIVMGVLPFITLILTDYSDISQAVMHMALATFIITIFLVMLVIKGACNSGEFRRLPSFKFTKRLYFYGIQRVPAAFGFSALMGIPVVFSQFLNVEPAQVVLIGGAMALLRLLGQINQVMTYVALPYVAGLLENNGIGNDSLYFEKLIRTSLIIAIAAVCGALSVGDMILEMWLGYDNINSNMTFGFWVSIFPLVLFYFYRAPIDGLGIHSQNPRNVIASLIVIILGCILGLMFLEFKLNVSVYFLLGVSLLGILSFRAIRHADTASRQKKERIESNAIITIDLIIPTVSLILFCLLTRYVFNANDMISLTVVTFCTFLYSLYGLKYYALR